jgi:SAM-dependent methyltransferase
MPVEIAAISTTFADRHHTIAMEAMNSIPLNNAASIIGVSSATVRNWVRAGHIVPSSHRPLCFLEEEVLFLKGRIVSGALGRLRSRANKAKSNLRFVPKEYSKHSASLLLVEKVAEIFRSKHLDLGRTLYIAALRLLELRGEVGRNPEGSIQTLESFHSWKREAVKEEIAEWNAVSNCVGHNDGYELIYSSFVAHGEQDSLGLLYQSLCQEGSKSNRGSYFTPAQVVDGALRQSAFSGRSFLDPCCGTGSYFLNAARILDLDPGEIYGVDIDEIATRIARINLLLAFSSHDARPKIRCANALTEFATGDMFCDSNDLRGTIDFIATNPPWGAFKNSNVLAPQNGRSGSNEVFSLFLIKSLELLKEGGLLSFVLPESILRVKTHSSIRKHILTNARIVRIVKLGRVFSGVFTAAIRIDLIKGEAIPGWRVSVEDPSGGAIEIEQARFASNEFYDFDVEINDDKDQVLRRIYAIDHSTLAGNSIWALGIVTGDNKKYLLDHFEPGSEPIYRGRDVSPFKLTSPGAFIHYSPDIYQQVAKGAIYRAPEKLIYKFISNSLVFAYDNKRSLTLNSANILVPGIPGISIKVALAFLNSQVFQYIFKARTTHKVLRGDLEMLPFPKISPRECAHIEALVDSILAGGDESAQLQRFLFGIFRLAESEVNFIRAAVGGSNGAA